jgi:hypothetical protein
VSIYRFANDRIAESWYVYDLFGLLQQLGALPVPQAAQKGSGVAFRMPRSPEKDSRPHPSQSGA